MMGGFLGQVLRGRARIPRWVRCGRGAAAVWLGFWLCLCLMSGAALGQDVPAASTPARTPNAVPTGATPAQGQQTKPAEDKPDSVDGKDAEPTTSVWQWKGLVVGKILFEGVTFDATDTLPKELTQKVGVPLDPQEVRASLRRLFASGRYRDIAVRGIRQSLLRSFRPGLRLPRRRYLPRPRGLRRFCSSRGTTSRR